MSLKFNYNYEVTVVSFSSLVWNFVMIVSLRCYKCYLVYYKEKGMIW
jgi:hypothetical protein